MEKLSYTINMGPNANHICLSKREAAEDDTARGEENGHEGKNWSDAAQAKE